MFKAFLVKYAEIGIKGKNRYLFEDALIRQMEYVLKPVEGTFHVTKEQGRIYVLTEGDFDYEEALEALKRVFGIAYICPVVIKEDQGYEQLEKDVVAYVDHRSLPDPDENFLFLTFPVSPLPLYPSSAQSEPLTSLSSVKSQDIPDMSCPFVPQPCCFSVTL